MKSSCRRFGGLLGGLRGGKGGQLHHSLFVSSFSSSSRSYQVHSKDDQTETKRLLDLLNKKRANGNYVEGGLFEHENHRNERTKQKQTLLLYRKALRQAKRFPDPTLRHFGYHRIAEQFRRHRCELAKKKYACGRRATKHRDGWTRDTSDGTTTTLSRVSVRGERKVGH